MRNDSISLSRNEMVMVLHDQEQEIEKLRAKIDELQEQLDNYDAVFDEAGSLADAAVQISKLFEAAQFTANMYLDNIKRKSEKTDAILEDLERQADEIISEAEEVARQHIEAAKGPGQKKSRTGGKKKSY